MFELSGIYFLLFILHVHIVQCAYLISTCSRNVDRLIRGNSHNQAVPATREFSPHGRSDGAWCFNERFLGRFFRLEISLSVFMSSLTYEVYFSSFLVLRYIFAVFVPTVAQLEVFFSSDYLEP